MLIIYLQLKHKGPLKNYVMLFPANVLRFSVAHKIQYRPSVDCQLPAELSVVVMPIPRSTDLCYRHSTTIVPPSCTDFYLLIQACCITSLIIILSTKPPISVLEYVRAHIISSTICAIVHIITALVMVQNELLGFLYSNR